MSPLLLTLLLLQALPDNPHPPLPPVLPSDLERFPDGYDCSRAENWNEAVQEGVRARVWVQNREPFLEACQLRWQAWWELDMANSERWWKPDCCAHLERLRDLIGLDAYQRGVMPCPVPVELLEE